MWDVAADLLLGSTCAGCDAPGRSLCRSCVARLPRRGQVSWPTPCPPGLALPMAAGEYAGLLRSLVNAHKEHQVLSLARPLGEVLAGVVADLWDAAGGSARTVRLVPVPSRRAVVRRRGHDPLLRMTRVAAARLRRTGVPASVAPVLRPVRRVADQASLDAAQRAANLAGSLACRGLPGSDAALVVVDDVLTTGATAREAQRALEQAGASVLGVAVVAATRRRLADPSGPRAI